MAKTNLDAIVTYPNKVRRELAKNKNLVSLLVNVPNADIEDPDIEEQFNNAVLDYNCLDGTITETMSFICIDTVIRCSTPTINRIYITLIVGVHKGLMNLKSKFKGTSGNRRDNLVREIDYSLRGNNQFGIGQLSLSGEIAPMTRRENDYICKVMTFEVPEFGWANEVER